ncbi:hypothetical protein IAQ61_010701 [Plenodomus lingam]|uniref:uncharacterized protein n=1 Tax=Leptosphaeria maculans TaxID=5022 RepID=UPI003326FEA3|nr:hypothetical protein IAQ61_010701 [Plenodomus lingam]
MAQQQEAEDSYHIDVSLLSALAAYPSGYKEDVPDIIDSDALNEFLAARQMVSPFDDIPLSVDASVLQDSSADSCTSTSDGVCKSDPYHLQYLDHDSSKFSTRRLQSYFALINNQPSLPGFNQNGEDDGSVPPLDDFPPKRGVNGKRPRDEDEPETIAEVSEEHFDMGLGRQTPTVNRHKKARRDSAHEPPRPTTPQPPKARPQVLARQAATAMARAEKPAGRPRRTRRPAAQQYIGIPMEQVGGGGEIFGQSPGLQFGQMPGQQFGQSLGPQFGQSPGPQFGRIPLQQFGQSPGLQSGQIPVQQFAQAPGPQLYQGPNQYYSPAPAPHAGQFPPRHIGHQPSQPIGYPPAPNINHAPAQRWDPAVWPGSYPRVR